MPHKVRFPDLQNSVLKKKSENRAWIKPILREPETEPWFRFHVKYLYVLINTRLIIWTSIWYFCVPASKLWRLTASGLICSKNCRRYSNVMPRGSSGEVRSVISNPLEPGFRFRNLLPIGLSDVGGFDFVQARFLALGDAGKRVFFSQCGYAVHARMPPFWPRR